MLLFWISTGVTEIWMWPSFWKLIRIMIKWKRMGQCLMSKNNIKHEDCIKQEDCKRAFHWSQDNLSSTPPQSYIYSNQIQAHYCLGCYSCFSGFLFHFHFTDCDTTEIKVITSSKFFSSFWRNFQALYRPGMASLIRTVLCPAVVLVQLLQQWRKEKTINKNGYRTEINCMKSFPFGQSW